MHLWNQIDRPIHAIDNLGLDNYQRALICLFILLRWNHERRKTKIKTLHSCSLGSKLSHTSRITRKDQYFPRHRNRLENPITSVTPEIAHDPKESHSQTQSWIPQPSFLHSSRSRLSWNLHQRIRPFRPRLNKPQCWISPQHKSRHITARCD